MNGSKSGKRFTVTQPTIANFKAIDNRVRQIVKSEMSNKLEHKYYRATDSGTGVDFGGACYDITPVPQGDTDVTRDGDKINADSLDISYNWTLGDTTNICRIIIFQWHPNSTPTVANILNTVGATNAVCSSYNVDNEQQYKILHDKTYYLSSVAYPQRGVSDKVWIKSGFERNMQFVAGGTTGTNHFYKLVISDSGAAPNPLLNSDSRLRFTDA